MIKFIYASSALVYEPQKPFGEFKLHLEMLAGYYDNSLGLRIFPVCGKGGHTVIEEWEEDIKNDRQPIVFADGSQTRSFIGIKEAIRQIVDKSQLTGTIDIGIKGTLSFNQIIEMINKKYGKNIRPKYVPAPEGYVMQGVEYNG